MRDLVRRALAGHHPREVPLGTLRDAAVMVLLHADAGVEHLLFQVRSAQVEHHRSEISFPGGRRDRADRDHLHTALRETHEELGVPSEAIEVLGQLDDTTTYGSGFRMRAYVGAVREGFEAFRVAEREVSELLYVPLLHFDLPESRTWKAVERDGVPEVQRAFRYHEHEIWGATARILDQFLGLIDAQRGRVP